HGNKITGTIKRFHELEANSVWILALLTVAWAIWRRRLAILALAVGALLWLIIEVAFALKGYPAVPRYMFEAGAVVAILAGVFAWYAGVKTGVLYVSPGYLKAHPHTLVNIYPIAGQGWKVFPSHVDPASAAACKRMVLVYR